MTPESSESTDHTESSESPGSETPETPEATDEPLSPEDARVLIGRDEADVIDIREDEDAFREEHLTGALHLPGGADAPPDEVADDKTLVLVCEDGKRSGELAEKWRGDGRQVTSIEGGMEAWKTSGMPTQPRTEVEFEGPELKQPGT